jgi:hypothetical protein
MVQWLGLSSSSMSILECSVSSATSEPVLYGRTATNSLIFLLQETGQVILTPELYLDTLYTHRF